MQETSLLYKSILADPRHRKEVKLVIAGVSYGEDSICSIGTSGGLYETVGIGSCVSRRVDLQVFPLGAIPKQAKIEIFVRLVSDAHVSEWIPKGVFYFANRKTDKVTGVMTVVGFDAMLKAEETWLNDHYAESDFPMSESDAVEDIASRLGVSIDPRTDLSEISMVHYPVDADGDMSMREVLSLIAIANAGNWIISDAGMLCLVPLGSAPPETNYLVNETGNAITFGGMRILLNG